MGSTLVLVINPGSTSTRLALYDQVTPLKTSKVDHNARELEQFASIADQFEFRLQAVEQFLSENGGPQLRAVVGRGGLLKPIPAGVYHVNESMIRDLKASVQGQHAANLGGRLAAGVATPRDIPAFIVDPVSVDDFIPLARISGLPQIERRSLGHTLNIRAVGRRVAQSMGKELEEVNFLVAHLGGGISIAPLKRGRAIDYNDANAGGPFSPERSGALPVADLVKFAFSSGLSEGELIRLLNGKSGLVGYLGSNDARELIALAEAGDEQTALVLDAMAYQIGKEIGAMATVLCGEVEAIILTGGLANARYVTDRIVEYVKFIAPIIIYPGEDEMLALAEGAWRVLSGLEAAKEY
ncbi:MAG: butyrate kinase [Bacillota bacterium]|jgi:butyrate kinase